MNAFGRGVFVALVTLSACGRQAGPAVVIDNWWMVDFARNSCKAANVCGVDPDDPGNVQEYIQNLKAQFAAAPICQGVAVFDYRGPNFHNAVAPKDNEQLIIDYQPNQSVQSFSIMGKPSNGIRGTGTITEIVRRTCVAARGLGGKVQ